MGPILPIEQGSIGCRWLRVKTRLWTPLGQTRLGQVQGSKFKVNGVRPARLRPSGYGGSPLCFDRSAGEKGRDLPDTGARRLYNGNVREYDNRCEMFPTNVLASMFHFEKAEFFEIESAVERAASKVDLGGTK